MDFKVLNFCNVRFILRNIPDELANFYDAVEDAVVAENSGNAEQSSGKINANQDRSENLSAKGSQNSSENNVNNNATGNTNNDPVEEKEDKGITEKVDVSGSDTGPPTLLGCDRGPKSHSAHDDVPARKPSARQTEDTNSISRIGNDKNDVNGQNVKDKEDLNLVSIHLVEPQPVVHPPNIACSQDLAMRVASVRSAGLVASVRTLVSIPKHSGPVGRRKSEAWGAHPSNLKDLQRSRDPRKSGTYGAHPRNYSESPQNESQAFRNSNMLCLWDIIQI
jgi:hypothetical protein